MKKSYVLIILFLIFIIFITLVGSFVVTGSIEIEKENDILLVQKNKEVYFNLYGYSIDNPNIIVNPYGNSPLTAIIMFETTNYSNVEIIVKSKSGNSDVVYKFDKNKYHILPIYGLYPDYNNVIIVKTSDGEKIINIETDALPSDFIYIDDMVYDNFVFYNSNYPYAIDINGEVRWYLSSNYYGNISFLDNSNILIGSDKYDVNNRAISLYEMDLLGKIYNEYLFENGYYGYSYLYEDNLLVLNDVLFLIDRQTGKVIKNYIENYKYDFLDIFDNKIIVGYENQFFNFDNGILNEFDYKKRVNKKFFYDNFSNYKITLSSRFGIIGETPVENKKIGLFNYDNIEKLDGIEIVLETNRIRVLNTSGSEIYLILDRFMDKRIYKINDLFYINTTGLNGKYTIYYKKGDKVYKTKYYVEV